jgi:predicted NUDIX family NTP pyrophosphohydrolase
VPVSVIWPLEMVGNLNSQTYLDILINGVGPAIEEVAHEDQEAAHVKTHLNQTFPNRWIGRDGTINWPARFPDLAPCDFFSWAYLKNKIYKMQHPNVDSLRKTIVAECRKVTT